MLENIKFLKTLFPTVLLLGSLNLWVSGCTNTQAKPETSNVDTPSQSNRMTDARDGEIYTIVNIGKQTWMAENLRYKTSGSWKNPSYPSTNYGLLYGAIEAQTVCPDGWHLPSDLEWNELEMTLGLPAADINKTGWRGEHGTKMKSVVDWNREGNGTNSSGFNAFPGGYFFEVDSLGGLGESMGFWSSIIETPDLLSPESSERGIWVRFLAGPLKGVNRFFNNNLDSKDKLACRCLKN